MHLGHEAGGGTTMRHVLIRYTVKPDQLERNLELLRDFFEELASAGPDVVRYTTFQLEDRVRFVHLVVTDSPERYSRLASYQRFRSTLVERCEEPPQVAELRQIGSFGFH